MTRRPLFALVVGAMLASMLAGCFGPHNVTAPEAEPVLPTIVDSGTITPSSTDNTTAPDLTGEETCAE